jgi:ribosomal protein S18 acetylase RimI-like enzyme
VAYQLRQCTEEDREWAYALKSEAYREVVERQFGPWDEGRQRAHFGARWNPQLSKVILLHGNAVGLIAVEERDAELRLDEIQLARAWRGRGIGTEIILDLLRKAAANGKALRLQVLRGNARARELYLRLGFAVTGETDTHHLLEARVAAAAADEDGSGSGA